MSSHLDSSVLVAGLVEWEHHHEACRTLFDASNLQTHPHALVETFSTLTGGRLNFRLQPSAAAHLIENGIVPFVKVVNLPAKALVRLMRETEMRGIRGGAIYDFLHLAAARHTGAKRLYTLDVGNFQAFHRPGDPEIVHP